MCGTQRLPTPRPPHTHTLPIIRRLEAGRGERGAKQGDGDDDDGAHQEKSPRFSLPWHFLPRKKIHRGN